MCAYLVAMNKSTPGLNVLLITPSLKDDLGLEKLLKASLQKINDFEIAADYQAALDTVSITRPAVIFSMLDTEDHLQFAETATALQRKISAPVILITADDPTDPEALLESVTDFISSKNLEPNFLRKTVQYSLEHFRNKKQRAQLLERFELLALATNDIIWDWELNKNSSIWRGTGLINSLGYKDTILKVDTSFWEQHMHPEDRARVARRLDRIFGEAHMKKWEDEYRFRAKNGEYRIFYDRGYIIYENKIAVRMVGIMEDITHRVSLEKKLEQETLLKQKHIAEAVVSAQENERTEIGKELHDNVNQLLTASKLYIDAAANDFDNKQLLLQQASGFITNAIEEIRNLSKVLHAPLINELGLCESIRNLAEDIMMVDDLEIVLRIDEFSEVNLNDNFKLTIYRIVQEQLTNIIKHAKASSAIIILHSDTKNILVEVNDDGIGFDIGKKRQGIGLSNIQSRVSMYEGDFKLRSKAGEGSRLTVKFPITELALFS